MALAVQPAMVTAGRGQATQLTMLHNRLADPVDAGVVADGVVAGVHEDDLVVLEGGVLVHPVGVEHAKAAELPAGSLLRDGTLVPLELQLSHTLDDAKKGTVLKKPTIFSVVRLAQTMRNKLSRNGARRRCTAGLLTIAKDRGRWRTLPSTFNVIIAFYDTKRNGAMPKIYTLYTERQLTWLLGFP